MQQLEEQLSSLQLKLQGQLQEKEQLRFILMQRDSDLESLTQDLQILTRENNKLNSELV
jgi:hypothetical protein